MISRDTDFSSKQESTISMEDTKTPTTTSSWSRLKDPRIVRVSRALGGKDRHSKVCTVRGLRDRRVRLSVPTAIQLYDLQERLGLNQPSKVVDWLLDAAKNEIDQLPPLQIPQGILLHSHHFSDHEGGKLAGETSDQRNGNQSWRRDDEDGEERHDQQHFEQGNFVQRQQNPTSFSSLLSSSNSFGRWDPSSLSLSSSQTPISLGLTAHHHHHHQHEDLHNFSMVHQSGIITQPYFAPTNAAFDHPIARTFGFNMAADRHSSQAGQQSKPSP